LRDHFITGIFSETDPMNILKAILIGGLFGVTSGFLGTLLMHMDAQRPDHDIGDAWYVWFALPSIPGNALAFEVYHLSDSYLDDEWDYWLPVTILNGLQWAFVFGAVSLAYAAFCDLRILIHKRRSRS
jgi:hypothetical protein